MAFAKNKKLSQDFSKVTISLASPESILERSNGEVVKPETINYRTYKPEMGGLFCERIFGPVKDWECHCGKYKRIRYKGIICDRCGVEVTEKKVRRERMGHIELVVPVAHIWYFKSLPNKIGYLLGLPTKKLDQIIYYERYVVIQPGILAEDGVNTLDFLTEDEYLDMIDKLPRENQMLDNNDPNKFIAKMGAESLQMLLERINLDDLSYELRHAAAHETSQQRKADALKRLRVVEAFRDAATRIENRPEWMIIRMVPVIPPELRPLVPLDGGRFATSDLNDLYRRVIIRNNRLKRLIEIKAPEVILRNEKRMLQEAVDSLFDNSRKVNAVRAEGNRALKSLSDMLKGKQGRFRQNLLGKRVDYSGRSVIVAGPELKIHQCGLPKMMALELFKPFVIGELIADEHAHNIRSATRMIETGDVAVWDALDTVIKGKYVLLNRAPSLHRLSIQAFQPVLIEGRAIQLHPLVCKGFNADFDGDQMAVHLPLSDDAQAEARDIMAANKNLLKPADGSPILHVEQDIVLGCYYLTYDRPDTNKVPFVYSDINEAILALDAGSLTLQNRIRVPFRGERRETTLGRLLFNETFPDDFPFQDEPMTKKRLQKVLADAYQAYGQEVTAELADKLKDLGFEYATISGLSMGMGDFHAVEGLDAMLATGDTRASAISEQFEQGFITEDERYRLTVDNWARVETQVQDALAEQMKGRDSATAIAINSGARGNIGQLKNAVGMLGVQSDASGRAIELPVRSGYVKGLNPLEYFTGTRGTRKALIDIALKTADAGYLTRRLVDVSQDVFTIDEEGDSSDPGFAMLRADAKEIGVGYGSRLVGRFAAQDVSNGKVGYLKKGERFTPEVAAKIDADESLDAVRIMSALSCTSVRGVPQKSYGVDPATGNLVASHHPIGVIAAQSIGEPGTQLSLDSKHRSGGFVADDTAQGLSRIEELFEVRTPKGQAYLTDIAGTANTWEEGDHYVVQVTAHDKENIELEIGDRTVQVKSGSDVAIGDVIASLEDGASPLIAPMAGKAEVSEKTIIITPARTSVVRYEIPGFKQLQVKDGDEVEAGQRLTNGSINLQDLLRLQGVEPTQRYIMNEILRIFAGQGQIIADKHLEIIVRQMFSRVQIEDAGDSEFVTGDVVSKLAVVDANERLAADSKELVQFNQLLLGITKSSLSTDSFLSAASFQDTTRVLIGAATSGRVDRLYGLKENVILGRKIPVGTGYGQVAVAEDAIEDQLAEPLSSITDAL